MVKNTIYTKLKNVKHERHKKPEGEPMCSRKGNGSWEDTIKIMYIYEWHCDRDNKELCN